MSATHCQQTPSLDSILKWTATPQEENTSTLWLKVSALDLKIFHTKNRIRITNSQVTNSQEESDGELVGYEYDNKTTRYGHAIYVISPLPQEIENFSQTFQSIDATFTLIDKKIPLELLQIEKQSLHTSWSSITINPGSSRFFLKDRFVANAFYAVTFPNQFAQKNLESPRFFLKGYGFLITKNAKNNACQVKQIPLTYEVHTKKKNAEDALFCQNALDAAIQQVNQEFCGIETETFRSTFEISSPLFHNLFVLIRQTTHPMTTFFGDPPAQNPYFLAQIQNILKHSITCIQTLEKIHSRVFFTTVQELHVSHAQEPLFFIKHPCDQALSEDGLYSFLKIHTLYHTPFPFPSLLPSLHMLDIFYVANAIEQYLECQSPTNKKALLKSFTKARLFLLSYALLHALIPDQIPQTDLLSAVLSLIKHLCPKKSPSAIKKPRFHAKFKTLALKEAQSCEIQKIELDKITQFLTQNNEKDFLKTLIKKGFLESQGKLIWRLYKQLKMQDPSEEKSYFDIFSIENNAHIESMMEKLVHLQIPDLLTADLVRLLFSPEQRTSCENLSMILSMYSLNLKGHLEENQIEQIRNSYM